MSPSEVRPCVVILRGRVVRKRTYGCDRIPSRHLPLRALLAPVSALPISIFHLPPTRPRRLVDWRSPEVDLDRSFGYDRADMMYRGGSGPLVTTRTGSWGRVVQITRVLGEATSALKPPKRTPICVCRSHWHKPAVWTNIWDVWGNMRCLTHPQTTQKIASERGLG